jgi:hypothetical protein
MLARVHLQMRSVKLLEAARGAALPTQMQAMRRPYGCITTTETRHKLAGAHGTLSCTHNTLADMRNTITSSIERQQSCNVKQHALQAALFP